MDPLTDQTLYQAGSVPPPTNSVGAATNDQTPTTTPCGHINSMNFLSQITHTGYTVRMKLPFLADTGPTPIFAFKVDPICFIPRARDVKIDVQPTKDDVNYYGNLSEEVRNQFNVITYNGARCILNGCESPQSLFARACRFRRYNMIYALRFSYQFSGTGLFAVVPFKGIPRGVIPLRNQTEGGTFVSANMFNSYALADGSRTREIKFSYPWEFPFKYRDLMLEQHLVTDDSINYPFYPDNWFVLFARGSFVAPANVEYIDIMIDHALTDHEFITPLYCHPGMYKAQNPVSYVTAKDGKPVRKYCAYINYGEERPEPEPEPDILLRDVATQCFPQITSAGSQ